MSQSPNEKKKSKKRKRLGEILVESGLIDDQILIKVLEKQKIEKKRIGQLLIDMGVATDKEIASALATQLKIPLINLKDTEIPKDVISLVPADMAEKYLLIPAKLTENSLLVVMSNPADFNAVNDLRFATGMAIEVAVATQEDILDALDIYYPKNDLAKALDSGSNIDRGMEVLQEAKVEDKDTYSLLDLSERPPVIRLTNAIISDAIKLKASDIHIEPQRAECLVRYRVDGTLREILKLGKHLHTPLVSRLKVISEMDISIKLKPQDGRTRVRFEDNVYDLRLSSIPTSYGEKVTIRILDQSQASVRLEDIGLSEKNLKVFDQAISRPQGTILVTGPTGSGKSTTLYACLSKLKSPSVNIITVEDPVEYDMPGINQVQVNPQAGLTFAAGLRSILRQDPDIVMIGEIRDNETASIAFQAANTGHLVLSTLHTNDAPSTVTRLLDLDIKPFLIASSLICVIGQRLVRKICEKCKGPDPKGAEMVKQFLPHLLQKREYTFWKGEGCDICQYTGYSGRAGIHEILMITGSLKKLLSPEVTAVELKSEADKEGFQSMTMDGIEKCLQGLTTVQEVFRVAPPDIDEISKEASEEVLIQYDEEIEESLSTLSAVSSIKPKKILVADDNEMTLQLLTDVLEYENYHVITATNGFEAIKLVLREIPDLIISDLLMPKMNGLALTKRLKSQLNTRFIPIIILTNRDDVETEVKMLESGANDYIIKPVNHKKLLVRIKKMLQEPEEVMEVKEG
ncbi:ATPase, T2SS/T4P/T4SS family [Thermodesulfobacteriota bacterium]